MAGKAPVKRNRSITESGATKSVNRDLEAKSRALAGLKGYITSLTDAGPEFVIDAYHELWRIEKSFRMSKHDLQARPIYHHIRESIEAHLTIVFAALAVSNSIEHQTGWSIKKFVRPPATAAPCRSEPASNLSPQPTPTRRPPPSPRHDQPAQQCALIRKYGDAERVTTDGPQAAGYAVSPSGLSVTV